MWSQTSGISSVVDRLYHFQPLNQAASIVWSDDRRYLDIMKKAAAQQFLADERSRKFYI